MATPKNINRSAYALIATSSKATSADLARIIRISKARAQQILNELMDADMVLCTDDSTEFFALRTATSIKDAKAHYDAKHGKPQRAKAVRRTEAANAAPKAGAKLDEALEQQSTTREGWLKRAVPHLANRLFKLCKDAKGEPLRVPTELQVSVGFVRNSKTAIGVCVDAKGSVDDKTRHVLVCPTQGDAVRVLDILLHELIHAALGTEHGHDKVFAAAARAAGLEGKPTATVAGVALKADLTAVAALLGTYPHVAVKSRPGIRKPKPGKSEWLRVYSKSIEGYCVNVRRDMLEEYGAPVDPEGDEMVKDKPW